VRITTTEEAAEALSAMLDGTASFGDVVPALGAADASVVVDAAAARLGAEARAVLGEKRWSPPEVRSAGKNMGFDGGWPKILDAALSEPSQLVARLRSACGAQQTAFVIDLLRMLDLLHRLPPRPRSRGTVDDEQAGLHAKVRALLAKAESTPYEAEATACTAKAQELMARYAIDEATARAGGQAADDAPTSIGVVIEAPYARPKFILLSVIATSNRCRAVWHPSFGFATVFGTPGDLWSVDALYTSLLVQSAVALGQERERSRSFRHAFVLAFAHRIGERLRDGTASAVAAATVASGSAFLPVLAAREDAAVAARDAAYPRMGSMRVSMSNGFGAEAGRAAANRARVTRDRAVDGPRRAVASGSDG
jgi:hypothetical protein